MVKAIDTYLFIFKKSTHYPSLLFMFLFCYSVMELLPPIMIINDNNDNNNKNKK